MFPGRVRVCSRDVSKGFLGLPGLIPGQALTNKVYPIGSRTCLFSADVAGEVAQHVNVAGARFDPPTHKPLVVDQRAAGPLQQLR
jgi:hypothetical protein